MDINYMEMNDINLEDKLIKNICDIYKPINKHIKILFNKSNNDILYNNHKKLIILEKFIKIINKFEIKNKHEYFSLYTLFMKQLINTSKLSDIKLKYIDKNEYIKLKKNKYINDIFNQ